MYGLTCDAQQWFPEMTLAHSFQMSDRKTLSVYRGDVSFVQCSRARVYTPPSFTRTFSYVTEFCMYILTSQLYIFKLYTYQKSQ
jgi:hypothetical protein